MFVALGIQCAMRMRHIAMCGLSGCTIFSTLSHKRHAFRKKTVIEYEMCVLFPLQLLSETFLILRRTERDRSKMHIELHVKYPLFLSDFNES